MELTVNGDDDGTPLGHGTPQRYEDRRYPSGVSVDNDSEVTARVD